MAERETRPTPRVVLMEFRVPCGILNEEAQKALEAQIGDADGNLPEELTIFVPIAQADGGPKAVIQETARTPGTFRAPSEESFGFRKRMAPPPEDQLIMEDV